jgi:hypothetical protein
MDRLDEAMSVSGRKPLYLGPVCRLISVLTIAQVASAVSALAICAFHSTVAKRFGYWSDSARIVTAQNDRSWLVRLDRTPFSCLTQSEALWNGHSRPSAPAFSAIGDAPWWSAPASAEVPQAADYMQHLDQLPSFDDVAFGLPFLSLAYRIDRSALTRESESEVRGWIEQGMVGPAPVPVFQLRTAYGWSPRSNHWMWNVFPTHTGHWPTRILWPGFLLNTLFWSCIIASPFWLRRGFVAWRSARRRRDGRCPACGYARGSINPQHPCPECGKSDPPKSQAGSPIAQNP